MSFVYYNPNPQGKLVGDCVIRALSKALDLDWDTVYEELVLLGLKMKDLPSSNNVWGKYLIEKGFKAKPLPSDCPACITVLDFSIKYRTGTYIVATGSHVVTIVDGNYYDTWDSGNELLTYYFERS